MNKFERLKDELESAGNGWTKIIYGKVVQAEFKGVLTEF